MVTNIIFVRLYPCVVNIICSKHWLVWLQDVLSSLYYVWVMVLGRTLTSHCSLWWCMESLTTSSSGCSYTRSPSSSSTRRHQPDPMTESDMNIASGCPWFVSQWSHTVFMCFTLYLLLVSFRLLLNWTTLILFSISNTYNIISYCILLLYWNSNVNSVDSKQ